MAGSKATPIERQESDLQDATEKKAKTTLKYPPYVNAYRSIPRLFGEITKASVPPKFTQDFMETVLGLKLSSHRALIPLLKKLGFIDASNVPTEAYRSFRDSSYSGAIMAAQVKSAYSDLYRANEYAHGLKKEELQSKLRVLTGAADDDPYIPSVVGTFGELVKLSDFKATGIHSPAKPDVDDEREKQHDTDSVHRGASPRALGLSYTINLNLPATTEIEVFNAIFKSIKEHLLEP